MTASKVLGALLIMVAITVWFEAEGAQQLETSLFAFDFLKTIRISTVVEKEPKGILQAVSQHAALALVFGFVRDKLNIY
ncbi:hypothetical protein BDW66DRAFT_148832 [Aspergillus desertorum]